MSLLGACSSSMLRLLASSSALAASRAAAGEQQQLLPLAAAAVRSLSSSTASSSGSTWNHNLHQLPGWTLPNVGLIPQHEIEAGLPEVSVWLRGETGTNSCTKLRRAGVTPCQLSSLPGNQTLTFSLDSRDAARLVRQYGRNGLQARVLRLDIYQERPAAADAHAAETADATDAAAPGPSSSSSGSRLDTLPLSPSSSTPSSSSSSSAAPPPQLLASVRVLPKLVHMHSVTQAVENFNFLFCPRDRLVKVNVPVKLWNDDVSPGVKAGGWLHVVNRTVPVLAKGWAVQPFFELDMRHMRVKDVLRFRDVAMPEGCRLHAKDPLQPVVRCAARVGGE